MDLFIYTLPFIFSGSLLLVYFIAPDFYLTYVLNGLNREAQVVENITFFMAFFAALILFKNAYILHRNKKDFYYSSAFVFIIALAVFFFAGEEASWGQSYFLWKTPEFYDCYSVETNLHNTGLPIHALGNVFVASVFIFIPLFWNKLKSRYAANLLCDFVIPRKAIAFFTIYGYLWREIKSVMKMLYTKDVLLHMPFYMDFVEQINEQKEMLLAVVFFIYALYIDYEVKKQKN